MAGLGDTTRIGDAVKVGIVDKPERELGINDYMQRKLAIWFEDVWDSLKIGKDRNIEADISSLHKLLDDFRAEIERPYKEKGILFLRKCEDENLQRELGVNEYLLNDDDLATLHRGVSIHLILEDGYQLWLKHA